MSKWPKYEVTLQPLPEGEPVVIEFKAQNDKMAATLAEKETVDEDGIVYSIQNIRKVK